MEENYLKIITESAIQIKNNEKDFDSILDSINEKTKFVLIGEATHGTEEFYKSRIEITKRLITEKNFIAVAVEADLPEANRVNQFIRDFPGTGTAIEALSDFERFPLWMWRNSDTIDFINWLGTYNSQKESLEKIGFYGIDLYSLFTSINSVIKYLDKIDPKMGARAKIRYSCFDNYIDDPQFYAYATSLGLTSSCENEVVNELKDIINNFGVSDLKDKYSDDYFSILENATVIRNAEKYYRSLFSSPSESWNLRNIHMFEILQSLINFLDQKKESKIVVWAHNSHVGDARSTDMVTRGELNLGQLVKEKYGEQSFSIGFTTYTGTVTAASEWGGLPEYKHMAPALPGSYEEIFHNTLKENLILIFSKNPELKSIMPKKRLERAIGVIYSPQTEKTGYFSADISGQFDALIHFDKTRALIPLERLSVSLEKSETKDLPETFPSGV